MPFSEENVLEDVYKRQGYSAHGIARMLNERNIVTHGGARFQTNHVLRMLRHRGYTGYMIAKENTSGFIPELQIVEESIYEDAMAIVEPVSYTHLKERLKAKKYSTRVNYRINLLYHIHIFHDFRKIQFLSI